MAQNTKPAAAKAEEPVQPKKSSKKLILGIVITLIVLLGAGGGWYFTKGKQAAHSAEEVKEAPPKPPIFVPLEPFTVNLQREASDQYLQLGLTMKVFDPEIEAKIKANLPEVRSKILQLLTTKTATELLTAEGKKMLVKEIISISNPVIGIIDMPTKKTGAEKLTPEVATTNTHASDSAASQPGETITDAQPKQVSDETSPIDAATTPNPVVKKPPEKKGISDVLFTSFIIQ